MAKQGGVCQGQFTRGRFTPDEMKVLSGLVRDSDLQLATLNRKATTLQIDSIYQCCRAKGMNRSRQQVYTKVKAIVGSDKGNARLQQPQQKKRRQAVQESGQASQLQAINKHLQKGKATLLQVVEQAVKKHVETVQASVKEILLQGQATLEQVAAEQATMLQGAVKQIMQQGKCTMDQIAAQQRAVQVAAEEALKHALEQVAAQRETMQKATVEALDQGQALLEIASAKQAAMHSAIESALEQGQSALELASARHESVHVFVEHMLQQVAEQQAAVQAVAEQAAAQQAAIQAALQEAQQGQVGLLDLLPGVGVPGDDEGPQVNADDEINLELEL